MKTLFGGQEVDERQYSRIAKNFPEIDLKKCQSTVSKSSMNHKQNKNKSTPRQSQLQKNTGKKNTI